MKHVLLAALLLLGSATAARVAVGAGPETESRTGATELSTRAGVEKQYPCGPGAPRVIAESRTSAVRLIGIAVTNPLNEEIGEVSDLILNECGRIAELVVRVGGFMGYGGTYVRIALDKVRILSLEHPARVSIMVRETRENILNNQGTVFRNPNDE